MAVTPDTRSFIVDTITDLLEEAFGDSFKEYFFGDPIDIPTDLMPCVIVTKTAGDVGFGPTGADENTEEITIQVVTNAKDELGNPAPEVTGRRKLMELVEGRDGTTGEYLSNSIMGVVRKNATLGNVVIDQRARIVYGVDMREADTYTDECSITLTVTEHIYVNNRS